MRLRLPGGSRTWGKYVSELLIVAAGVALGLWATEWADDRRTQREVNDAYKALEDELTDNLAAVRFRKSMEPCVRRRISELRSWIGRQGSGERRALPAEIGRPASYALLDSVWEVSKSGQIAAKMPLEERRRYAAVYDVLERSSEHQKEERQVWFSIGDYAGLSELHATDLARLNGYVSRAAAIDEALSLNYGTLSKDLALLKIAPPSEPLADLPGRRTLCTPLDKNARREGGS